MVKPDTVDKRIKATTITGKVPIGIINFKYNQIDTNSVINNLLENPNGIFYDVPNRLQTPYRKKQVSIISPLIDSIEGLQINFQTSPAFFLQNTGHTITYLKADFNNGRGLIYIGLNSTTLVNYSSYGKKIIKFIIKYQDNTQITTYAYVQLVKQKRFTLRAKAALQQKELASAATVSYDIAPGGSRSSFSTLADQGQGYSQFFQFLLELGKYTKFTVYNGSHSFVPTKSALAFKGTNEDLAESVYDRNLVCTGETPFNTYYGSTKNLEHSYIDSPMAKFAIDEIAGKHRRPSYVTSLPSVYISGPDKFCEPGGIYSLQGSQISPGTSLAWTVSPAIASISSGKNSTQVQLSKISRGTGTLSLQLNKTCGLKQTFTKTFSISGYSSSDYPVIGPSSGSNNQYVYFSTNQLPGATNYSWFWPGEWTYLSGQGTNSLALRTGNYSGSVGVRVANACDAGGSPVTIYVQVYNYGFVMNAAPNPTIGNVTITTATTQSLKSGLAIRDKIYKLEVIDVFGNIKKKFNFSSGETNIKINVSTLISGTYVIHAFNGKAWAYERIVIAH